MDKNEKSFSLPDKPKEPLQEDCCGSGCSYCVFDVYQAEVVKWKREVERILQGEKALFIEDGGLSQLEFKSFELVKISKMAKNMNFYQFAVPGGLRLDIKPGQHLIMKGFVEKDGDMEVFEEEHKVLETFAEGTTRLKNETDLHGKAISRPYTVLNSQLGFFEVLIKIYDKGEMSKYVRTLRVGNSVLWRGPFGNYRHIASHKSDCGPKTILAICAGTGVAPVYAISKSIVNDEDDDTRIRLLWSNHSWEDVPLVKEMKELASYWNFSCRILLSDGSGVPPSSKTFFEVTDCKINNEILSEELDSITTTNKEIMVCGTETLEEDVMAFLVRLGLENCVYHRFK